MNTLPAFLASLPFSPSLAHSVTPSLPTIPYRPFIDPIAVHQHWYLFLPLLALGIAIVYKAVRLPDLAGYIRGVLVMTVQIVVGMILLAAASYFLVLVFATWLANSRPG